MNSVKVFVRSDNAATIICPVCNAVTQTSVARYRNKKHAIKIRCKCKTVFEVELDFRRHYRMQISLPGTYRVINPPGGGGGVIHIRNISRNGLGFTISGTHHMRPGQTLRLEFIINDKNQTKLTKEAKIRLIEKNYIGCQFVDEDNIDKALGFYLRR